MKNTGIMVVVCMVLLGTAPALFAASDSDGMKGLFLKGDYADSAAQGQRLLAAGKGSEEICYLTGLSCLKSGDPAGAASAFEKLLREFRRGKFTEEARVGIADSVYLRGDLRQARSKYEAFLVSRPGSKLRPGVYYRLYLLEKRDGSSGRARQYKDKISTEFPQSPEAAMEGDIFPAASAPVAAVTPMVISGEDIDVMPVAEPRNGYIIQVGAFSKRVNAESLAHKLAGQGYSAYVDAGAASGKKAIFKVKVGPVERYAQARELERKLARKGYPTKLDRQ